MSLEQFKTQILLLHSEQSTLDRLSAGFNDRYTVHCATSGSEALNTLGETDIDVLVTAQNLPGMSGLDALREARRRSPETIGILLAGNDGAGVEALVGDKEVFQIVRGSVTPDSLRHVIDNATRHARLMALAESANDTTADMDASAEHIIMETSENGSSIITDVTGRLPVLNPDKVAPETNVGARTVDVLVLTKDEEFLTTVRESARGMHKVIYANTLAQADDAVRRHNIGVAVIDAAMLGENVEKLTLHLRATARRLVAIVAGRRDDGEMLMELINRGKVYRFLLKPVSPGRARLAIEASVKHHLEAPDAAFKTVATANPGRLQAAPRRMPGGATAKTRPVVARPTPVTTRSASKPATAAVPAPKTAAKPAEKTAVKPAVTAKRRQPVPTIRVEPRLTSSAAPTPSLIDDGLNDAFGGSDTSFTETMTGIAMTVGKSLASVTKRDKPDSKPAAAAAEPRFGTSLLARPKIIAVAAVATALLYAAGTWFLGNTETAAPPQALDGSTPLITEVEPEFETQAPADPASAAAVEEARLAAAAGQIFNPPGSNAIELYMAALDAAEGDPAVAAELAATVDRAIGMAESALLARRPVDAAAALQRVALADPDNPRLPFLNAQLAQMQLRDFLDAARLGIREGRFEDAAVALSGARALGVDAATEIKIVADELSAALSEQRVEDVLAKANARLDEGKLTAPSNDNARYYFELAMSNDPGNSAARQGLTVVASKLVLQARAEIDAGRFDAAEVLLADARRLDPSSPELSASTAALSTARDRLAAQQRAAAEKAAADKLAAQKAAADKLAAQKAAADKLAAEKAAADKLAAEKAAADKLAAEKAAAIDGTASQPEAADTVAAEPAADQAAEQPVAAAAPAGDAGNEPAGNSPTAIADSKPVSVSSLERTRYVAPKYPRAAQRRNMSGWVDVVFTVDIDGRVIDIAVPNSEPGVIFVNAAVSAVENWEFKPVIENGVAVPKRAAVRMMFAME